MTRVLHDPAEAARIVRRGGIVAFPTETVYGLAADATNREAVERIFAAKGRPAANPLIIHLGEAGDMQGVVAEIPEAARRILMRWAPGPVTVVLRRSPVLTDRIGPGNTVGIRIPSEPIAREFLRAVRLPVAAPSANLSGRPSPTSWNSVLEDLDGKIDAVLTGPRAGIGLESTVIDCTGPLPMVLRPGFVTYEELATELPEIRIAVDPTDRSPGTRFAHYQPRAQVHIGGAVPEDSAWIGMGEPPGKFRLVCRCGCLNEYASSLFEFFREADRAGVRNILCEDVPDEGLGRALRDRILRAAGQL